MKKIGVIWSLIKTASAWLHGEGGGKHFRTYTYPRIKSATRKIFNLGIYERFEHLYKIVDDTFYGGVVDETPQGPEHVLEMERLAQEDEGSTDVLDIARARSLPNFKDIKDKLFIWQSIEQARTYRCVTFTFNNMLRTLMLQQGLKPELEVTSIDPLYIATKHGRGKTGTVVSNFITWAGKNGMPLPSWSPQMKDHNKELQALESNPNTKNALKFSAPVMTGRYHVTTSYDKAVELNATLPANWQMQVSIDFSDSLRWFGQEVPHLRKRDGRYNLTRTGGHSVHGVRDSFSVYEDGEPGFAIIDSAYRSSETGFRFVHSKLMKYGIIRVRFVEYNLDGTRVKPTPVTPKPTNPTKPGVVTDSDKTILAQADIDYGMKGETVKALQRYLVSEGHNIPAGITGNFFNQTRNALKEWQDKHFGPKYSGEYWRGISRQKFIELNS